MNVFLVVTGIGVALMPSHWQRQTPTSLRVPMPNMEVCETYRLKTVEALPSVDATCIMEAQPT